MSGPKTIAPTRTKSHNKRANDQRVPQDSACCEHLRERAYYKWEAAGCPCGDGTEFWLQAEADLASETQSAGEASTA